MSFFKVILLLLLTQTLFAERVEITSTSMEAQDKEVHFIGNARVQKANDWLHADRVIVYFDENNETSKYEAIGTVTFAFKNEKNSFKGSADKVVYNIVKSLYELKGRAVVDDLVKKRHVSSDEIILDMVTGSVNVKGSHKKPAKLIFDMGNP
ncbi:MAG TPA: LptA/OstA family protein [Sulfurovum sp.]|nr:LptA/OstA family protein [Sulfurovum sp.]